MSAADFALKLVDATVAMHESGIPLMRRIIPAGEDVMLWDHYPPDDAVSPRTKSRYFYHCHPPAERSDGEHGHFHFFLPKSAFSVQHKCQLGVIDTTVKRADVVHIAALSIDHEGLPLALFTVNRWVSDEWLYPAPDIAATLNRFDLTGAPGDARVNQWLTAIVGLARPLIIDLLHQRDSLLRAGGWPGEDRAVEITSHAPLDLQSLVDDAFR